MPDQHGRQEAGETSQMPNDEELFPRRGLHGGGGLRVWK